MATLTTDPSELYATYVTFTNSY